MDLPLRATEPEKYRSRHELKGRENGLAIGEFLQNEEPWRRGTGWIKRLGWAMIREQNDEWSLNLR